MSNSTAVSGMLTPTSSSDIKFKLLGISITLTTISEYRRKKKPLKFAEIIPLFLVLTDVEFNLTHGVDHLYAVITNDIAQNELCRFFGWGTVVGYNINAFMNILGAVYVFLGVYFSIVIDWGQYYWKAMVLGFVLPTILGTVPLIMGQIVDVGLFCNITVGTPAGLFARIVPQFTAVFSCLGLYVVVYAKIYYSNLNLRGVSRGHGTSSSGKNEKLMKQGAMLIGFAFAYVVQWGQITILQIMTYRGQTSPPSALISAVLFGNAGGFWTALKYFQIMYQKQRKRSNKNATSSSSTAKTDSQQRSLAREGTLNKGTVTSLRRQMSSSFKVEKEEEV
ncbi:hypothetical protein HK102_007106 [Quaeritorhiza haematococci]|nr:hypothetical protein HK102_007106 [Quaeritorhiza haematococci]